MTAYEMRIIDWSSDLCSSDLRRNGVAANALRTVLRGDIFRKCIDGAFAGGIGGRIEIAPLCRARTDVDDGAATLRYHERQCMLAHQHRPACVHAHDLVPEFDRHGENITIIYIAMIGGIDRKCTRLNSSH